MKALIIATFFVSGFAHAHFVKVARSVKGAMAGHYTGEISIHHPIVRLKIDGQQYQYHVEGGICTAGVAQGGCTYNPTQPDGIFVSDTFQCTRDGGSLTTYQISTLKLYNYGPNPMCKALAQLPR